MGGIKSALDTLVTNRGAKQMKTVLADMTSIGLMTAMLMILIFNQGVI